MTPRIHELIGKMKDEASENKPLFNQDFLVNNNVTYEESLQLQYVVYIALEEFWLDNPVDTKTITQESQP